MVEEMYVRERPLTIPANRRALLTTLGYTLDPDGVIVQSRPAFLQAQGDAIDGEIRPLKIFTRATKSDYVDELDDQADGYNSQKTQAETDSAAISATPLPTV
jgi:hypothetical protein